MARMSLEDVIIKMKEINPNILITGEISKLVGKTDIRNRRYIICKCLIDGYEWESEISLLLRGRGCNECGKQLRVKDTRLKIEVVKQAFIDRGYTPLFKEYKKTSQNLSAINSEGYKISACYSNLTNDNFNPSFFGNGNPHTIENIRLWISKNRDTIELLDDIYIGSHDKLKFRCLIHNEIFYLSWSCLQSGIGCAKCAILKNSGETHYNWKGGISLVYVLLRLQVVDWRVDSYKKYDFKCDISGVKLENNVIHHIIPFRNIVEEAITLLDFKLYKNTGDYEQEDLNKLKEKCVELHYKYGLGICLSRYEHINFHRIYGNRNTTLAQYEEYKEMRLKELSL